MTDTSSTPTTEDPFFAAVPNSEWIALLGKQGNEQNYLNGYIEAAIALASAVIDKRLISSRDTLVMPILYTGRHALELTLKFSINRLRRMGAIRSSHPPNHDVLSHWKHLRDSAVGDRQIRDSVVALQPYVTSLDRVDDDGQGFRYAETRAARPSLAGLEHANLCQIRSSLEAMGKVMTRLTHRVLDLENERRTCTYTDECSRSDLKEIAGMLGPHENWSKHGFDDAKKAVMDRYGLSSRKFSMSVTKIEGPESSPPL